MNNKSRMTGDFHVRICEKLGLKCPCLLDVCHEGNRADGPIAHTV